MVKQIDSRAIGKEVFVYRNLHNGLYSVRDVATGRVLGHSPSVTLTGCKFKVSEAGRQRVIRTKRKNVHAGVQGRLVRFLRPGGKQEGIFTCPRLELFRKAWYNPYETNAFRDAENKSAITESGIVLINKNGVHYKDPRTHEGIPVLQ